jgi:hypothetical protein
MNNFVPDIDEENAEEMKTMYSFSVNDVFMVFEYVDFDLAGLLASPEVVCILIRLF